MTGARLWLFWQAHGTPVPLYVCEAICGCLDNMARANLRAGMALDEDGYLMEPTPRYCVLVDADTIYPLTANAEHRLKKWILLLAQEEHFGGLVPEQHKNEALLWAMTTYATDR